MVVNGLTNTQQEILEASRNNIVLYKQMADEGLGGNKVLQDILAGHSVIIEAIEKQINLMLEGQAIKDHSEIINYVEDKGMIFLAWDKKPVGKKNKKLTVLKFTHGHYYIEVTVHEKNLRSGVEFKYEITKALHGDFDWVEGSDPYITSDPIKLAEEVLRLAGYPQ